MLAGEEFVAHFHLPGVKDIAQQLIKMATA
jgi:hypothetical protein